MKKYSLGICAMLVALMLGLPKPLSAGTLELTFTGASSYLGGYYVAPYQIEIGSTTYNMICDDAHDDVTPGEQWNATTETFSNLSDVLFSQGYVDNNPSQIIPQTQAYEEAGWLVQQINNTTGQTSGEYQYALWDLFDPGFSSTAQAGLDANAQQEVNGYLTDAENQSNYTSQPALAYDANLVIYTPTPQGPGEPQEYIGVGTPQAMPEPATLWSLLVVLAAVALACKWMGKTAVKSPIQVALPAI